MPYSEGDITPELTPYYEGRAKRALEMLKRNNINGAYVATPEEALQKVIELIGQGTSIGIGDSVTLHQIGFHSWLAGKGRASHDVFFPMDRDAEGHATVPLEQVRELNRKALTSDVYVTGTNAITLDGKLVNVDGGGNRVAAMCYGPKKVIFVAGANKIVEDEDAARQRIRELCAPLDALRHVKKHHHQGGINNLPCVKTGWCAQCRAPDKICCSTLIIAGQRGIEGAESTAYPDRMQVIIIGKHLGY